MMMNYTNHRLAVTFSTTAGGVNECAREVSGYWCSFAKRCVQPYCNKVIFTLARFEARDCGPSLGLLSQHTQLEVGRKCRRFSSREIAQ